MHPAVMYPVSCMESTNKILHNRLELDFKQKDEKI